MRVPALIGGLRPPPSHADIETALRTEVRRRARSEEPLPSAWTVWLAPRDFDRISGVRGGWPDTLADSVLAEAVTRGLVVSGLVTVSWVSSGELRPGRFQVGCARQTDGLAPRDEPDPLPGRPRLVLPNGGTARWGSAAAAGLEREVLLRPGLLVVGRGEDADLRLDDTSVSPRHAMIEVDEDGRRIRLSDAGSTNGVKVDGVPTLAQDLRNGNRIELGEATLLFQRGDTQDDGGRQGGETRDMIG